MPTYLTVTREYAGAAGTQKLLADIGTSDTALTLDGFSGWPTGASGPFCVTINYNGATEEKLLFSARSGAVLSGASRGYDGTTAYNHFAGETVQVTYSATDAREANFHSSNTAGIHGISGNVVGTTDVQTLTNKALTTPGITDFSAALHDHSSSTMGGTVAGVVTLTGTQTLSNKTLTAPVITDYTNAGHTHLSAAQGGVLPATALSPGYANSFLNNGGGYSQLSAAKAPDGTVIVQGTATHVASWGGNTTIVTGLPAPKDTLQHVFVGVNLTTNAIIRYNLSASGVLTIVAAGAANDTVSFEFAYQS